MKSLFYLLCGIELILIAKLLQGMPDIAMISGMAAILIITLLTYHYVSRLRNAVDDGVNLLKAQDYASRLRKVGQPEADSIVELFNDLMDHLKQERQSREEKNLFLQQLIDA
ncbi:MAG: PAS domain-containing sensor histidine kinase, partial [Muribaculaceae bacterium]|nr:PAS domain-containing sensor histidine kinase [Muribaculaceae bacterium]